MKKILFHLFRRALCEDVPWEEPALDREAWIEVFKLSKQHDLAHLAGYALKDTNLPSDEDLKNAFEGAVNTAAFRYVKLNYDLETIKAALEKAKITFIPLKGSVIRKYYNEPWLRTSCDIDILISSADIEKATKVFVEELGHEYLSAWNYEVSFRTPSGTHIELHHTLSDDNKEIDRVLSTVWEHSAPAPEYSFYHEMSDEMYYFYHVAHMVKHFVNGGCGIRSFIDIWVLNHRCSFDRQKRYDLLEKAGLLLFAQSAEQLADAWIGGKPHTAISEELEQFILNGGLYGTVENRVVVQQAITGSKFSYLMSRIFLPYDQLKLTFPGLTKRKWLFPFYQVKRWFRLFRKGKLKSSVHEVKNTSAVTGEENDRTTALLQSLGIKA